MKAKSKVSLITLPALPALVILAILSILAILGICIFENYIINHVSALEYTTNYNNSFTLNPSINVSLSSSDLVISDLLPNTSSDSNIITINVTSNNSTGYVLNSSVGSSINSTTDLKNEDSSSYVFSSLAYNSSVSDLSDFDPNTWGYSYSDQTVASPTWSNYSGLPLYSDTTNVATLKTTNTTSLATGDNIRFKIAAKASSTQGSGEYTNIINFIAVGNPTPVSFYDAFSEAAAQPGSTISQLNGYYKMQDMSADICSAVDLYDDASHIQLIDTRDNEVYWIGKLKDDRCWLLDNLRLGSNDYPIELTPEDTNIETAWTLPKGVTSGFNPSTASEARVNAGSENLISSDSLDQTDKWQIGTYYNFCAASGGSYCYPEREGIDVPDTYQDSPYDICPKNWRIPIEGVSPQDEYATLYNINEYHGYELFRKALHIPLSGVYDSSAPDKQGTNSNIWSSTYGSPRSMKAILVENTPSISPNHLGVRGYGRSVRCVADN